MHSVYKERKERTSMITRLRYLTWIGIGITGREYFLGIRDHGVGFGIWLGSGLRIENFFSEFGIPDWKKISGSPDSDWDWKFFFEKLKDWRRISCKTIYDFAKTVRNYAELFWDSGEHGPVMEGQAQILAFLHRGQCELGCRYCLQRDR